MAMFCLPMSSYFHMKSGISPLNKLNERINGITGEKITRTLPVTNTTDTNKLNEIHGDVTERILPTINTPHLKKRNDITGDVIETPITKFTYANENMKHRHPTDEIEISKQIKNRQRTNHSIK